MEDAVNQCLLCWTQGLGAGIKTWLGHSSSQPGGFTVFLGKILYSQNASFHSGLPMSTDRL